MVENKNKQENKKEFTPMCLHCGKKTVQTKLYNKKKMEEYIAAKCEECNEYYIE